MPESVDETSSASDLDPGRDGSLPESPDIKTEGSSLESPDFEAENSSQGSLDHLMTWDNPPQQSDNPRHWTTREKWINVSLVSIQATLPGTASTILGVASAYVAADFGLTDDFTPTLPVALFVLGLGLGPLYAAPCSELYGRRIVYIIAFGLFAVLNVGCALANNITALTILRLLSGMAGSAGPSLGGATIGDMFIPQDRGSAQALYGFGPTGGPIIGGLIGGFIVHYTGNWRWCMWPMVIAPGVTCLMSILFLRETYGPVILKRKALALSKRTGETYWTDSDLDAKHHLAQAIVRPFKMLFLAPICTAMSVYISLIYGIFYLHMTTLPLLFGPVPVYGLFSYEWSSSITSLAFLGVGAGIAIGSLTCAKVLNSTYAYMERRNKRKTAHLSRTLSQQHLLENKPEFRMPLMQVGMLIVPIGLIVFAWTAQEETFWLFPLIGAAIFAFGMILMYICIQTYLVDAFEEYAASALAATILSRSVVGCIFSIIGFELYKGIGYGWGSMLLAFICLAIAPLPAILYIYGPSLRRKRPKF